MKVKAHDRQTIFDLANQWLGSIAGVFDIVRLNRKKWADTFGFGFNDQEEVEVPDEPIDEVVVDALRNFPPGTHLATEEPPNGIGFSKFAEDNPALHNELDWRLNSAPPNYIGRINGPVSFTQMVEEFTSHLNTQGIPEGFYGEYHIPLIEAVAYLLMRQHNYTEQINSDVDELVDEKQALH